MMKYLSLSLLSAAFLGSAVYAFEDQQIPYEIVASGPVGTAPNMGMFPETTTVFANDLFYSGSQHIGANAAIETGTNAATKMLADDHLFALPVGTFNTFSVSLVNNNATPITVRSRIRIYSDNGAGGGPGTALLGASTGLIGPLTANTWYTINLGLSGLNWSVPTAHVWVGYLWDNLNGTGAGTTAAELSNIGWAIFLNPVVGSSTNNFWKSTNVGSNFVSNPAGTVFNGFTGGLPGNFFSRVTTVETPTGNLVTGTVVLGDYTQPPTGEYVKVTFSNGTTTVSRYTPLNASGGYTVNGPPSDGTWNVTVQGRTWLAQNSGTTTIQFMAGGVVSGTPTLFNGDCDGDNEVGLADFGILSGAFGTFEGDAGFSYAADLDGDAEVGLADFGILSSNFGMIGD